MVIQELVSLLLYLGLVVGIGIYFFVRDRKNATEKDYFLGGRNMGGWVSALSAGASDMSAWVLMGLPGAIYLKGVGQLWIAVGLFLGTVLAWIFVAPAIRRYSIAANDSITIPQFLNNRFCTKRRGILVISAVVFMITYCIYAASSIYACGTLFNTVLGMNPKTAMIIASSVIVLYTFLGGYNAVCWTDFFQGLLMLAALLAAPICAVLIMNFGNFTAPATNIPAGYYNMFVSGKIDWKTISDIISGLGWGLGYFGMPHIMVRYISIKNEKEMKKSQIIGSFWIFLILLLACVVGLSGRAYLGDVLTTTQDGNTLVFINMVRNVCVYIGNFIGATGLMLFLAGMLLSAILASAMSTADSQLLASSSAFASDLYKPLIRKNASDNEMLWAGRAIVLVISVVAFFIAANPQCKGIMNLVSCAWAAFGSAFGPVVILALYWKRLTYNGALAGIIAGFIMNVVWYNFLSHTGIYEIVPGFAVGLIATYVVSLLDKEPSTEVVGLFNKAKEKIDDVE
jgi:sodium/proline symporter